MTPGRHEGYELLHIPAPPGGVLRQAKFAQRLSTRPTMFRPSAAGYFYIRSPWGWRCMHRLEFQALIDARFRRAFGTV